MAERIGGAAWTSALGRGCAGRFGFAAGASAEGPLPSGANPRLSRCSRRRRSFRSVGICASSPAYFSMKAEPSSSALAACALAWKFAT